MAEDDKDLSESFDEFRPKVHAIIIAIRDRIGRMPTREEVSDFIWADDDDERDHILKAALEK